MLEYRVCDVCKNKYPIPHRNHHSTKFCSNACRQWAYREKKRLASVAELRAHALSPAVTKSESVTSAIADVTRDNLQAVNFRPWWEKESKRLQKGDQS